MCTNPWTTIFVWGNGDVTHCCYSNIGPLGNIHKQSLDQILKGKKLNTVRTNIAKGKYVQAGCEHFCRPFRWNQYYSSDTGKTVIPEGLGRISQVNINNPEPFPTIIGLAMDWRCNFKCTHCQAPRNTDGLNDDVINKLWPYVEKAKVVRFVDGEFSVNKKTLNNIKRVSTSNPSSTVFMNTNGHIGVDQYFDSVRNLDSFHLKFSLEGLGEDFEKIRIGGNWNKFKNNLLRANEIFNEQCAKGKDWKLYLNCCVMVSNFEKLPEIVQFAVTHNIRLVLNTVNGMRHLDENFSMYKHLTIPEEVFSITSGRIHSILNNTTYCFSTELKQHLDYISKVNNGKKLAMPMPLLKYLNKRFKGQTADRVMYILYKWQINKFSCILYLYRKAVKRINSRMRYFYQRIKYANKPVRNNKTT